MIEGQHFLDGKTAFPWFRVTEPVAVIPALGHQFGGRLNFSAGAWDSLVFDQMGVWIPNIQHPQLMLGVVPLEWVRKRFDAAVETNRKGKDYDEHGDMGAIPIDTLIPTWKKIVPGFWAVKRYYESGTEDDFTFYAKVPEQFKLGEELQWEIWT